MTFKKKNWFFRDSYNGYSPAEIVGVIAIVGLVAVGVASLF